MIQIPIKKLAGAALNFNLDARSYLVDQAGFDPTEPDFADILKTVEEEMTYQKRQYAEAFRNTALEHGLVAIAVTSGMDPETYLTCYSQINTSTPPWQRKILVTVFTGLLANATPNSRERQGMEVLDNGAKTFS